MPEIHALVRSFAGSFVIHPFISQSFIHSLFTSLSRNAVGGRVDDDSERWLHLAQKDGKEVAERDAALLKIQFGFSFCVRPDSCHAE
jgi:hypothetical protein